jgi:hypothetical protein
MYEGKVAYVSVLPVEQVPLSHTCPGGLAVRIALPGSPIPCGVCGWSSYAEPRGLILREFSSAAAARVASLSPDVVLVYGGEPLASDWVLNVPSLLRQAAGASEQSPVLMFSSLGLLSEERLEEARKRGFRGVLLEHAAAVEDRAPVSPLYRSAEKALGMFDVVEVHFYYAGSRRADAMLSELANTFPEAAINVVPVSEEDFNAAARVVEKLRSRGFPVYLYGGEDLGLGDVVCPHCRSPLVSRGPLGLTINVKPSDGGSPVCSSCGSPVGRLILCRRERPARAHREYVIW